jgi:hypothetical protein
MQQRICSVLFEYDDAGDLLRTDQEAEPRLCYHVFLFNFFAFVIKKTARAGILTEF